MGLGLLSQLVGAGLCLTLGVISTEDVDPEAVPIRQCMDGNLPERSSVQTVEFTAVDRAGGERISRAKIYGKKLDDGYRRLKLKFTKPDYMRDSEVLIIETDRSPDTFLYTPELRRAKRVTGRGGGGNLFGTDFSYEDFERWQGFNRPGKTLRRPDSVVADRAAYVLWTLPADDANSSYTKIVTYVDRETCVTLKAETFETGERLRKLFTADPSSLLKQGGIWLATEVLMQDVRDETHTRAVIEDIEVDRDVPDRMFSIGRLGRRGD